MISLEVRICSAVLLIGILLLIYSFKHDFESFISKEHIVSAIDGKSYPIVGSFSERQEAADMLGRINNFLVCVIKNMKKKYVKGKQGGQFEREITLLLLARYNPDVLFENNPVGVTNTSYVTNKGTSIAFCLREKTSGNNSLHEWPLVQFVALHEISHIVCEEHGHGPEFWNNFKFMENEAVDTGLYKPINFNKYAKNYCGVSIQFSPYYSNWM
jgi:hypothetical protein